MPLPQFLQPICVQVDTVTAVSVASPGFVAVGTAVTRGGSSGLCALSGAGRLPTGMCPHGQGVSTVGCPHIQGHMATRTLGTPASPVPTRALANSLVTVRVQQGGAMGFAHDWDRHPCDLEGMGDMTPWGFLWEFQRCWG